MERNMDQGPYLSQIRNLKPVYRLNAGGRVAKYEKMGCGCRPLTAMTMIPAVSSPVPIKACRVRHQ